MWGKKKKRKEIESPFTLKTPTLVTEQFKLESRSARMAWELLSDICTHQEKGRFVFQHCVIVLIH